MKLRLISLAMLAVLIFASCRDKLVGPPTQTIAASDTVAHWAFFGNSLDVSGHGHDGTMSGNYDYNMFDRFGNYGKAIEVIGPGQMNVQSMPNFSDSDSFTISYWVNVSAGATMISPNYGFGVDTGEFGADLQGCGLITSNQPLGTDRWRLITVAVSAHNNATLYVDSTVVQTKAYGSYTGTNDSMPLQIIFNQASGSDTVRLGDALILHYCLNPAQVSARFQEGGWATASGFTQGSFGTSANIEGMCFAWVDTVYACGFNGTILRSIDGGTTWAAQSSGTTENLYRIRFQDWNHGIVGGNNGTLLKTTDAGATWNQLILPSYLPTSPNIRDLYWSGPTNQLAQGLMLVVGGVNSGTEGFTLSSTDGGNSWAEGNTGLPGALYGIDQTTATVVGNAGQIYKSGPSGVTWTDEFVSGAGDDLMQVSFSGQNNGITVSAEGVIYQTNNGGTSWSGPQQSPVTSPLRAVSMVSQTEAWIAGASGVILHSTNNGGSWSQQSVGGFTGAWNDIEWPSTSYPVHKIAFVGDNGTLYWLNQ